MNKVRNLLSVLSAAFLISLAACNNDGESVDQNKLLVGLWESTEVRMTFSIGQVSLYQYYMDELGLTDEEADEAIQLYGDIFASGLIGSIEFNEDNTFTSTLGSSVETGTWWIVNSSTLKLTEESRTDQIDLTIVTLNTAKLVIRFDDTNIDDINEDGIDEEILIEIELVLDKAV